MLIGGIGKMFKINSNSWECTGDGQALAYLAGAELMDMEFMQFHPTGMVWPPSVRGTLITEGVRGEGGTLRNKTRSGSFDYIPPLSPTNKRRRKKRPIAGFRRRTTTRSDADLCAS